MCHYQTEQINNWNRLCIYLSKSGKRNLLDYRHVGGSPTKGRAVLLATAGSTGCSDRDLWLISTVPQELSAVINVFGEKPQAVASLLCAAAFLKCCAPFCAAMAKASLLLVWTMERLWRQISSVPVAQERAKSSPEIFVLLLNSAAAVQGTQIQGKPIPPIPHIVTVPVQSWCILPEKAALETDVLSFDDMDLLRGITVNEGIVSLQAWWRLNKIAKFIASLPSFWSG